MKTLIMILLLTALRSIDPMIRDEVRSAVFDAISAINELKDEIKKKRVV